MRQRLGYLGSAALALLAFAAIGVVIADDPSEDRNAADVEATTDFIHKWATEHLRPGEVAPQYGGCELASAGPPIRYDNCKVTFRHDTARYRDRYDLRRYRGYDLELSETASGELKVVSVRRRPAGPRAYD